ncbi:MauE/DoxX family redox-associated membrane protein [Chitinophaga sancti]|uniref:MauE/DoxX family redox-associated membrane protein n=1 Tax=Chitinophaga sancti TaxID=1004 RepID=UPI003F78B32A
MKSSFVLSFIRYALCFLFLYTSFNKLMAFDYYLYDLKRSPLLSNYAIIIAILVPGAELLVAALLLLEKTIRGGLLGSLGLMVLFTIYVGYVLLYAATRPCTCGGIIRNLTWPQHFVFNICFLLLSILGLYLQRRSLATYFHTGDAEKPLE